MEYKVNTSFNVGDKLYSLCSNGDINTFHISKIKITGELMMNVLRLMQYIM